MAPPSATDMPSISDIQAETFSGPLSVNGVSTRRAKAPKMSGGIAAHASSDMFKSSSHSKPKAKRWDYRLNEESVSRLACSLKAAAKYLKDPDLISLGGGLPSSEYYPFEEINVKVPIPSTSPEADSPDVLMTTGKHDIRDGKSLYDIHVALNYGQATGSPQLLRFVTEHTEIVHDPPYQDWQCSLTVGNTSALDVALRMFTTRGDYIMSEEYTFVSAVETAAPMGVKVIGIKMDEEGLIASSMDQLLSDWNEKERGIKKPWLLYTVPSGQNPTGATQSLQRRRDIYRCAQKHDVYIFEDEPYYFLQMQPYTGPNSPDIPPPTNSVELLKSVVPSLLSIDVDGRVLRMDSFSKTIAPGLRTGWITAPEQIVERYVRHHEVSTQGPAGLSQLILYKLLDETWGHDKYFNWLCNLRLDYTKRRDIMCYACEEYLPSEVVSWVPPMAGMFHWIKIDWQQHPHASSKTMLEIEDEIFHAGIDRGVLAAKGSWFRAEADGGKDLHFRMTFAAESLDKIKEAIRRLGEAVRAVFLLQENGHLKVGGAS